jgi:hypothetical protein
VSAQGSPAAIQAEVAIALWGACRKLDTLAYSPSYTTITGSLAAGVLLAQILYWFRPGKDGKLKVQIQRKGKYWLAKSREGWRLETGLSFKQLKSAMDRLISLGIVQTERHRFAGKVCVFVHLNEAAVLLQIEQMHASAGATP